MSNDVDNGSESQDEEVLFEYYTGPGTVTRRRVRQGKSRRPKPHLCEICERAFDRPSALLQHMHTHTGARPHLCPVCKEKRFATTSNLYRHSRSCKGAKGDFISVNYGEQVLYPGQDVREPQYGVRHDGMVYGYRDSRLSLPGGSSNVAFQGGYRFSSAPTMINDYGDDSSPYLPESAYETDDANQSEGRAPPLFARRPKASSTSQSSPPSFPTSPPESIPSTHFSLPPPQTSVSPHLAAMSRLSVSNDASTLPSTSRTRSLSPRPSQSIPAPLPSVPRYVPQFRGSASSLSYALTMSKDVSKAGRYTHFTPPAPQVPQTTAPPNAISSIMRWPDAGSSSSTGFHQSTPPSTSLRWADEAKRTQRSTPYGKR